MGGAADAPGYDRLSVTERDALTALISDLVVGRNGDIPRNRGDQRRALSPTYEECPHSRTPLSTGLSSLPWS